MGMSNQDGLVYCHNRHCERDDCIRKETYMPFGVCCKRANFNCTKENGYKHFLGEETLVETISSSTEGYIDYLNKVANELDIWFYIEPFVGNSESIFKIEGKFVNYGTDLDREKIEDLCSKYPDKIKNFQARDYKTWDKVLLNDKYKGHCIVYCEPPYINKQNEFDMKEFLGVVKKWSSKNKVYVRMPQKAKNWKLICSVSDVSSMFEVT
jgi:hypothetical protein